MMVLKYTKILMLTYDIRMMLKLQQHEAVFCEEAVKGTTGFQDYKLEVRK